MMQALQTNLDWYRAKFESFEKSLNGLSRSRVHGARQAALVRFAELGFPGTNSEEWRFTNVAPIAKAQFAPVLNLPHVQVSQEDVERFSFGGLKSSRLVFVNGHFVRGLSSLATLPQGAKLGSLAVALQTDPDLVYQHLTRYAAFEEDAFTALNTAFLVDGAFVYVPDGKIIEDPVHFLFISAGTGSTFMASPRNLIVTGNNSQVSIVESYVALGQDVYFTNAVTEMLVGENAVIEHDKLQLESGRAFHIGTAHIQQRGGSTFTSNAISLGGSLVRNNVTVVLGGEGIESTLNGLSLATGTQHIDNHTTIDHAQPRCASHELYKSILDGEAKGVFNGKIFVRRDAQKTDAKQTNKTLLLSDGATIDTKPQLEIFADDVKCTHGATVGQLDEEQVFYLRSRGIGLDAARDLLTFAFASDVISRVHVEPLRAQLDRMIHARLRAGRLTQG